MTIRYTYLFTVPVLYLVASGQLAYILGRLPDRIWEWAWLPAIVLHIAIVFLPTAVWLAGRAGPRWKATTALNAAAAHAVAALLLYALLMSGLWDEPHEPGIQFDVPRTEPGFGEILQMGLTTVVTAAALAALLSLPVGAAARAIWGEAHTKRRSGTLG